MASITRTKPLITLLEENKNYVVVSVLQTDEHFPAYGHVVHTYGPYSKSKAQRLAKKWRRETIPYQDVRFYARKILQAEED